MLALVFASLSLSCSSSPLDNIAVSVGLTYGGQLRQVRTIPYPADPKEMLTMMLSFEHPTTISRTIEWHLDIPIAVQQAGKDSPKRVTLINSDTLPRGSRRFEKQIALPSEAAQGLLDLRIFVDDKLLFDEMIRFGSDLAVPQQTTTIK